MRFSASSIARARPHRRYRPTWWIDGAAKDAAYFDDVRQAHRDAANLRDEFVRANLRLVVTMAAATTVAACRSPT